MPPGGTSSAMTLKRINREVADLQKEDLGQMALAPTEDNLHVWRGTIPGPEGSVYEGGVFNLEICLPADYPFSAPRVTFKTRIYHMNISETGNICIDILKTNWSPALSLFKVMLSISSLLTDPNPQDPLVPNVAQQYTRNRRQHDTTAREWTALYAKPKVAPTQTPAPRPSTSALPSVTQPQQSSSLGSSRGRGGRRSTTIPVHNTRAGSNTASVHGTTPIIVIDDDDEVTAGSSSSAVNGRRASAGKRKREGQGVGDIVDLVANEEGEGSQSAANVMKKRRTASSNNQRVGGGDVIVIEDD